MNFNEYYSIYIYRGDILIATSYSGHLNCYQITRELKLLHSFDFTVIHPGGVGGVLYHTHSNILIVGGWGSPEGEMLHCVTHRFVGIFLSVSKK